MSRRTSRGHNDHHGRLMALGLPLVPLVQRIGADSVRQAITTVFSRRPYDRSLGRTLLDMAWDKVVEWWDALIDGVRHSGPVRTGVYALLVVVFIVVVARIAMLSTASAEFRSRGAFGGLGSSEDAWGDAERLANAGQYTDAAHALYRGLLSDMARQDQIQLHHSKTVGDYGRDLRRRSSSLAPRYRDFARTYETVVYGLGTCDRERYERLFTLATGIVRVAA
jgi:hypothetical protein